MITLIIRKEDYFNKEITHGHQNTQISGGNYSRAKRDMFNHVMLAAFM